MIASPRLALAALFASTAALVGAAVLHTPVARDPASPAIVSREAKIIRAGVFQFPVLGLAELAAIPPGAPILQASLPTDPSYRLFDQEEVPEIPGDAIRDDMKVGVSAWPEVDRSAKEDLGMSRLPPGVATIDEDAGQDQPGFYDGDSFLPDLGSPPLARLSRQLEAPPAGSQFETFRKTRTDAGLAAMLAERMTISPLEPGGDDGAVPLDHTLAPRGGTSPAVSRPDLAALDTRTTTPTDRPIELAATSVEPMVTIASVHPTTEEEAAAATPILSPDEGLTKAQKNARIAGMAGLDDGQARPLTLPPVAFTRAQICLATAVYFEARGEDARGQIAVAQVVINRVRSPFYPKNVCAVVYQGASARRYGGCQFSFACDGVADRVTEAEPWKEALDVAQRVLDAEAWLPEVGNATHYHANYVRPRWIRDMVEKDRIGKHIFYRVKGWA